jgi:hypothetical protein
MKDMPGIDIETDRGTLYEEQMGGYRSDVQGAMEQAGSQAISMAAQTGREVADVMSRYLPEAVKGFGRGAADIASSASQQAQQGQVAKTELQLKQKGMADEMARFDASQQQQQYQFEKQLATEYQMNRERMSNNLRVAQAQASSQAQLQSINNAHAMQMAQMTNEFKTRAAQYAEAQKNARQSQTLQVYDKWQKSDAAAKQRDQMMKGSQQVTNYGPQIMQNQTQTWGGDAASLAKAQETYNRPYQQPAAGSGWIGLSGGTQFDINNPSAGLGIRDQMLTRRRQAELERARTSNIFRP